MTATMYAGVESVPPAEHLRKLLSETKIKDITSSDFADALDVQCPLAAMRKEFHIPLVRDIASKTHDPDASIDANTASRNAHEPATRADVLKSEHECVYLCGNSLGLEPKQTREMLMQELDVWAESGVHGHFNHRFNRPWVNIDDLVVNASARIVGAKPSEVAVLNTLTVNLHLLMVSFYRPTQTRFKILIEDHAFPSDHYAVESQIKFHGFDPKKALITVKPRTAEDTIRTEDILKMIEEHGETTALILFSGVQYYTGQLFDMKRIVETGHRLGCHVGFDLAHAAGNAKVHLHDWNVDFAAWCSYKYLNSGPGGIAGLFVHEKHHADPSIPRLLGWWGNKGESRFQMKNEFDGIQGANVYRMSNPCVLAVVAMHSSLKLFEKTSMKQLNEKTRLLTGYLEFLLDQTFGLGSADAPFVIMTPRDPAQRGCQLSLRFKTNIKEIFAFLTNSGVVCDERKPDCIRIAPVPMYNSYRDVWNFVQILNKAVLKK